MTRSQLFTPALFIWLFIVGLFCAGVVHCAHAQDTTTPMLLVAAEELQGAYRGTVILATPIGGDRHVGVILNKPTRLKMGELFPTHEPSQKVVDPVYFGGPAATESVIAMVSGNAPHPQSLELAPGVWLVIDGPVIDRILEATPNHARYFAGFVLWSHGELADAVAKGMFVLRPFDAAKIFLPDTTSLHEDLKPKRGQVSM